MNVVLFRDRQQYLDYLRPYEPQIDMSLGAYRHAQRTAFFYEGDTDLAATWRHESTHQLFHEVGRASADVGALSNFWIIEGVAIYMESLVVRDGFATVGGIDADRLQYARYRALNEGFYVPLAELAAWGRQQLQQDPRIGRLYSQSAGLAHFFLDSQGGRHRRAFVASLRDVYAGRDNQRSLAQHAGATYDELDRQYAQFLHVSDNDLAFLKYQPHATKLALGHTAVTDRGLAHLKGLTKLQWLDISHTQTGDTGLASVGGALRLNQLNLQSTGITDASCAVLGKLVHLEELDLSNTAVSDAGLAQLSGLKQLKTLWLTGTSVSDSGLKHLQRLQSLETLDLSGTRVTRDGWSALRRRLPKLKAETPTGAANDVGS
jgi:hypothetical protein